MRPITEALTSGLRAAMTSLDPELPLESQPRALLLWKSLRDVTPGPHVSGKTVIVGHTAQKQGKVLDLGYLGARGLEEIRTRRRRARAEPSVSATGLPTPAAS